jgi:multisubunit Na+/H+ antiporter MnhE subunit
MQWLTWCFHTNNIEIRDTRLGPIIGTIILVATAAAVICRRARCWSEPSRYHRDG